MWFGVEQGNEKILFYYNTLFSVNCHSSLRWTDTKGNKMVSLSQNRQRGGVGRRVFCVWISHFPVHWHYVIRHNQWVYRRKCLPFLSVQQWVNPIEEQPRRCLPLMLESMDKVLEWFLDIRCMKPLIHIWTT